MMNEAPISFAPAVAHKPIGPCAKTTTVSPMRMFADSAPLNPVEAMSASKTTCSSVSVVRNLGEVRLRVWHKQIFGLRAVDGVAESPAADRLNTFAVAALRPLRGQTGAALTAGRDRADQNAITDLVSGQSFAEFFDHADRFVSDHQSGFHRVFAAQDVQVRPADGG